LTAADGRKLPFFYDFIFDKPTLSPFDFGHQAHSPAAYAENNSRWRIFSLVCGPKSDI
jgi:hypothetical protein